MVRLDDVHSFWADSDADAEVLPGRAQRGPAPALDQYIVMVSDDDGGTRQLASAYYA